MVLMSTLTSSMISIELSVIERREVVELKLGLVVDIATKG